MQNESPPSKTYALGLITSTTTLSVAVQPLQSETVTVYSPGSVTVIDFVVSPVDQRYSISCVGF